MKLLLGDCLEILQTLPENSVDKVLCDLPYGTTACKNIDRKFVGIALDKKYLKIAEKRLIKK